MRGESQAFNNYNKKIIKKLTNSNATFLPPPQSDGLTDGRGCNDSELKNKNKTKPTPPGKTHAVSDLPLAIQPRGQVSTTVENTMGFLGFGWFFF